MNCPEHEEVSAYIDGMLPPSEREQFVAHTRACPICLARIDELLALRRDLRELPSPTLGFDLAARLGPQLRRPPARRPMRAFWIDWGAPGLAAALSLAVGAWLGGMLLSGGAMLAPSATMARVFDPVPPGGLCAAAELCGTPKGLK
ncbi:MAG TPA: zf-HC2 domain-containing protein [Noviherbaspirillum sp.]|uniref:anti-sigma factor family protein n=1 Tax=Noviherbaspirillum sp. TaxID=1926288 RepID=UPI002B48EF3E|nr:zf-HC2 domain-containing protein [Noviherbaspirillum sp.]HJV84807.1 zf-HC2 domain-containing protein [Noviherbaspirillum sp.]